MQNELTRIENKTCKHTMFVLNLAMAYDSQNEIMKSLSPKNKNQNSFTNVSPLLRQASQNNMKLSKSNSNSNLFDDEQSVTSIKQHMDVKRDLDIIIRFKSDIENDFFPLLTDKTEWYHINKSIDDFTIDELNDIIIKK
jgi:undecaprenyl pyrophosphate synthase